MRAKTAAYLLPIRSAVSEYIQTAELGQPNTKSITESPIQTSKRSVINVPFKICAKAYSTRLAPIAQRVINRSQSAFLKGHNILEGPVVLQEIIHELKRTKQQVVLLKLDFEKAYDRVNW